MTLRILVLLMFWPAAAFAGQAVQQPLTPQDFAYGMALEVDGDGALYSFELPEEVYRYTVRRDLGDMRLFNGYNKVVPHLVSSGVKRVEGREEAYALQFFPLHHSSQDEGGDTQVHIATDESGAVVDFWQRSAPQGETVVARYLIDASNLTRPIEKLHLEWEETGANLLETVTLEYSNDLTSWQSVAGRFTLAALSYDGYRLTQREIELPPLEARYLRLSWPLGVQGVLLKGIRAVLLPEGGEAPRQWLRLLPAGDETREGSYRFDTGGHFPVDRLQMQLPQANTVVRARLYSREAEGETPWRLRHQGLLYRLQRDGHNLQNEAIQLTGVDDRYWRLVIDDEGGGFGQGLPQLELGWIPHQVHFVARGESPFSLAYGAAGLAPLRGDLGQLLENLQNSEHGQGFIKSARPGPGYVLGGKRRLEPPKPPLPWQSWLLWAVLFLGVMVLALIARQLVRQMGDDGRIN